MELLQARNERKVSISEEKQSIDASDVNSASISNQDFEGSDRLKELMAKSDETDSMVSDSEHLLDIFETDTENEEEREEKPLYMDQFEKIPVQSDTEDEDFEEHLRRISANSRKEKPCNKDEDELADLDDVDRMVLRAASLLKKKRK